jgi:hypothetical protein
MPFHTNALAHNADFKNSLTTRRNQEKPKKRDDTSIAVMVGSPGGERFMAPTEIVGASLFNQTRRWKTVKPQKSRYADANLLWSGWASPSRKEAWDEW